MATSTQLRGWWADYACKPDKMVRLDLFGKYVGTVPAISDGTHFMNIDWDYIRVYESDLSV